MSPERWRRINEIFHGAAELRPDERAAFVERECADDLAMAASVWEMLAEDGDSGIVRKSAWSAMRLAVEEDVGLPPTFAPGRLLAGRYRVLRFLNRGGMGEVYEAEDLEFGEPVALKTLLPAIAADATMIARFKQEIHLSRKVGHPSVCRVFDLSRDPVDPAATESVTYFLTMQLLTGETLSARLQREGTMTLAKAMPLLEQMGAGLDAAHAAGVIHRDFKPSNVMLVAGSGGEKAVITDFGLARSFTGDEDTRTHTGNVMGTLDYMAPELFAGRKASIASDVYALGKVARKMVGETTLPGVEATIARALDTDPARRPASASALAAELAAGIAVKAVQVSADGKAHGRRTAIWVGGLILVAMACFIGIFGYYRQGAGIASGSSVYVMALNNTTQDAELNAAGDLLQNQVRQSARIRVVDEAQASRARALIAEGTRRVDGALTAREVALRVGAVLVVFSTLSRVGDSYDLAMEIQRVGSTPAVVGKQWRKEWQAHSKPQIFAAIHEAGDWVRTVAGETPAEVRDRDLSPDEAASSSWEALSLYQQAEALKAKREIDGAIALLHRALSIDPEFALAHVRLADYLSGERRQEQAFEHYRLAIQAAGKRRLTRWEELHLRGTYALDLGEYVEAEGAFQELKALYPHDPLPVHHLAAAVRYQGRLAQSVQLELESLRLAPESTPAITSALQDYVLLGQLEQAEGMARKLGEVGSPAMATEYAGVVQYQRGNVGAALSSFEREGGDASALRRSRAASLAGALLAEAGVYERAAAVYEGGLSSDLAAGLNEQAAHKHLALAYLAMRRKENAAARIHALEAVRRLRSLTVARRAGSMLARCGYVVDAGVVLADLEKWPGPLAATARSHIRGEILLAQGDPSGALRELEAADRGDLPWRARDYLARAYAQAGDGERALFLYRSMTRSRAGFLLYADGELPGLRAGLLLDGALIAARLKRSEIAQAILREYLALRPNADSGLAETVAAVRLAVEFGIPKLH